MVKDSRGSVIDRLRRQIDDNLEQLRAERRTVVAKVDTLATEAVDMMEQERDLLYTKIGNLKVDVEERDEKIVELEAAVARLELELAPWPGGR